MRPDEERHSTATQPVPMLWQTSSSRLILTVGACAAGPMNALVHSLVENRSILFCTWRGGGKKKKANSMYSKKKEEEDVGFFFFFSYTYEPLQGVPLSPHSPCIYTRLMVIREKRRRPRLYGGETSR